jgi:hypothetical protein
MAANSQLVIAFDARIGRLESQLQKANTALAQTNRQARQAQASVSTMQASFERVGTAANAVGSRMRGFLAPLLAIFAGGAITAGIQSAVSSINQLSDAAAQVGVNAQQLQALTIAFQEAGSNGETAQLALGKLAEMIGDANRGGKEAQETFVALGVSFRNVDGSARTTSEAFNQLIQRIRGADSLQEQLSMASAVVGARNARALVAAIAEMGPTIDDTVSKYAALGLIIGKDTADALDRIGSAFARLSGAAATAAADMVASFEPQIVKVVDGIREMVGKVSTALQPLRDVMSRVFGDVQIPSFEQVSAAIVSFVEQAVADFAPLFEAFMRIVREIGPVVIQIATLIATSFAKVAQDLAPIATWILNTLGSIIRFITDALRALGILERSSLDVARESVTRARRALQAAQGDLEAAEAAGQSPSVLVRNQASERALAALERRRVATLAVAEAERKLAETEASLRPPTVAPTPATPTVAAPSGTPLAPALDPQNRPRTGKSQEERDAERRIRDLNQQLERLFDSTRTPLEEFTIKLSEMWEAVGAAGQGGVNQLAGGLDTVQRAVLQFGEQAVRGLRPLGEEGIAQIAQLRQQLIELGPRVLGSSSAEDLERWAERVDRVLTDTKGKATDFWSSFKRGLGLEGEGQGLDQTLGEGLGKLTSGAFDDLFNMFDKIADGSVKAGEAIKVFALDFVKSVAKMVAQAAAMRLISTFLGGTTGTGTTPRPPAAAAPSTRFGGARMAGGAVAGGYTFLVGERGPELFTAPAAGMIIPNSELGGGGMQVIVNQNAPGVVVERKQLDARTVMLAVNLSRQQVAADFAESARTGHGSYAEPMMRGFAIRRRV